MSEWWFNAVGAMTKCDLIIYDKVIVWDLVYNVGTMWVSKNRFTRFLKVGRGGLGSISLQI